MLSEMPNQPSSRSGTRKSNRSDRDALAALGKPAARAVLGRLVTSARRSMTFGVPPRLAPTECQSLQWPSAIFAVALAGLPISMIFGVSQFDCGERARSGRAAR